MSKSYKLILWKFEVDFWKCVSSHLNDFGKCECEWSVNFEFLKLECEHVFFFFAYLVFDKLFIWDFEFDSLFLICFKSGGFNVNEFSNNLG